MGQEKLSGSLDRFFAAIGNVFLVSALFCLVRVAMSDSPPSCVKMLETISPLLKDRQKVGTLDQKAAIAALAAARDATEAWDTRVVATYALMLSDMPGASEALQKLREDQDGNVAGAARFAIATKRALAQSPDARLAIMSYELGRSQNKYEQAFYVNWLGCEYRKEVVPLLLRCLETKQEVLPRHETYYQILLHGDHGQLRAATEILDRDDAAEREARPNSYTRPSLTEASILAYLTPEDWQTKEGVERRRRWYQVGPGPLYRDRLREQ